MADLAEFLLSRIAEDETEARLGDGPCPRCDLPGYEGPSGFALAECEAKRRIIAEHARFHHDGRDWCRVCVAPQGFPVAGDPGTPYPCATLRALALPYADHSGYRLEWA